MNAITVFMFICLIMLYALLIVLARWVYEANKKLLEIVEGHQKVLCIMRNQLKLKQNKEEGKK